LSRRSDWKVGVEKDNKDETLVKSKWLEIRKIEKIEIIIEEVDLLEKVKQSKYYNITNFIQTITPGILDRF